jgi:hypothetical protein
LRWFETASLGRALFIPKIHQCIACKLAARGFPGTTQVDKKSRLLIVAICSIYLHRLSVSFGKQQRRRISP